MKKISAEEFKKRYGTVALQQFKQPEKSTFGQRTKESFNAGVSKFKEAALTENIKNPLDLFERVGKAGVGAGEAIFSPVTAAAEPVIRPTVGRAIEKYADRVSNNPSLQRFADSKAGQVTERITQNVSNYNAIAGMVTGPKLVPKVASATSRVAGNIATKAGQVVDDVAKPMQQRFTQAKQALQPPVPTPKKAMGQVLQGETSDVAAGFKAMQGLDKVRLKNLTSSTTYQQLADKSDDFIKQLAGKVDDTLDNTTPIKLEDLQVTAKTTSGQIVKSNYVERAMTNLRELYKKIGDDVEVKNMDDLINQAKTTGLTRRQVNDLSRKYGIEFGDKAFNKMGDPLTSVNAQGFELTRKGLKNTARQGMGGKQAQALDETISNLYTFKKLVSKNAEAVQKLSQRIQERGLLEKIGHQATKVLDVLSGGSLRGMIGGLLPRGAGYKVMNALDLQEVLQRNLKIIEQALQKGDDASLINVMRKVNTQIKGSRGNAGPGAMNRNLPTIKSEDQQLMKQFIDYTRLKQPYNYQLELAASRIAEQYNLKMPKNNAGLANEFDSYLTKYKDTYGVKLKDSFPRPKSDQQ